MKIWRDGATSYSDQIPFVPLAVKQGLNMLESRNGIYKQAGVA